MDLKQLTDFLSGLDITGLINSPWRMMYIKDNSKNITLYCAYEFVIKNVNAGDNSIREPLPGAKEVNIETLAKYIFTNVCNKKRTNVDNFVKGFKTYLGQSRIQKELTFVPGKSNLDSYLNNERLKSHVYHTSSRTITLKRSGVMWFALDKSHSILGWHKNILNETGTARTYVASVRGRIATDESSIRGLFKTAKIDIDDYINVLVGNPTSKDVLKHGGTKLLMSAGFDGFIYLDYNPLDFSDDLESMILFNLNAVQNWKLLKENK